MARLSRNEIEEGTQADKRRSARNKLRQQQNKTGRHGAAKKSLPLRRGQGR